MFECNEISNMFNFDVIFLWKLKAKVKERCLKTSYLRRWLEKVDLGIRRFCKSGEAEVSWECRGNLKGKSSEGLRRARDEINGETEILLIMAANKKICNSHYIIMSFFLKPKHCFSNCFVWVQSGVGEITSNINLQSSIIKYDI